MSRATTSCDVTRAGGVASVNVRELLWERVVEQSKTQRNDEPVLGHTIAFVNWPHPDLSLCFGDASSKITELCNTSL